MFFRKSTSKIIRKLTKKHGYKVAYCMMTDIDSDTALPEYAQLYYVLVKDSKMFGLIPTGSNNTIEVIPFNSELVGECMAAKSDFVELSELVEGYGYTLCSSILQETKVVNLKPVKE